MGQQNLSCASRANLPNSEFLAPPWKNPVSTPVKCCVNFSDFFVDFYQFSHHNFVLKTLSKEFDLSF